MGRIRELREAKGWGQIQLAKKSGVSQSGISDIENGKRVPSYNTMRKIASALGVTVLELEDAQTVEK